MPVSENKESQSMMAPASAVRSSVAQIVGTVGMGAPTDEVLQALDSLGLVELVVRLEEHFLIEIPDTALTDTVFASIDNLAALILESGLDKDNRQESRPAQASDEAAPEKFLDGESRRSSW